jgi:hypothetical protein
VTFFMVGDAERLAVFLHCKMTRLARNRHADAVVACPLLRDQRT